MKGHLIVDEVEWDEIETKPEPPEVDDPYLEVARENNKHL